MQHSIQYRTQQGAILIVSLLLLLIMTLLALTTSQTALLQERMTGNTRNLDLALQSAEAAVRNAEQFVAQLSDLPDPCTTSTCIVYGENSLPQNLYSQTVTDFWDAKATEYGSTDTQDLSGVTQDPVYIIEKLEYVRDSLTQGHAPPQGRDFFRVAAYATGNTDKAKVVLESTYTRRF